MKNAGKACNNRLYRHIRTFEKIVKNYFVIYFKNISIMVPPTTTKAKATKMYRQITMTINFKTRYM